MIRNKHRPVKQCDVIPLFNEAYKTSVTIASATNGYRTAGLWPLEDAKFNEELLATAAIQPTIQPAPGAGRQDYCHGTGLLPRDRITATGQDYCQGTGLLPRRHDYCQGTGLLPRDRITAKGQDYCQGTRLLPRDRITAKGQDCCHGTGLLPRDRITATGQDYCQGTGLRDRITAKGQDYCQGTRLLPRQPRRPSYIQLKRKRETSSHIAFSQAEEKENEQERKMWCETAV